MKVAQYIVFLCAFLAVYCADQAPGGFIEKSFFQSARRDNFDLSFVPSTRGAFDFPLPYYTHAYRITDESDGVVEPNGYSYWAKINNHQDSDMMYIVAAMDINDGVGPTLFSVNKTSDEVKKIGQLFSGNSYAASDVGSWYFSFINPTKLYIPGWNRMFLMDVLTKEQTDVFDSNDLLADSYAWQTHVSANERAISFTLRRNADYSVVGCAVYFIHNKTFALFDGPEYSTEFDECQIDKSGRYLLIKANIDGQYDVEGIFIDLDTGKHVTMLDQDGAPGHSDEGWNTVISGDNFAPVGCRFYRYDFEPIIDDGYVRENLTIVWDSDGWANSGGCPQHISWVNAKDPSIVPYEHQFLCGSNVDDNSNMAKNNEIVCWRPDSTRDVLIVAPSMTFLNASGGGNSYNKMPKAVIDVTGDYILWSSNLRSDRIDIFVVRVPWHFLVSEQNYRPSPIAPQSSETPTISTPQASTPQVPTSTTAPKSIFSSGSILQYCVAFFLGAAAIVFI